jgi:probable rRNA maturation factor
MLEVEVVGLALASGAPSLDEVRRLCTHAAVSAGVREGHVAIEFVEEARIAELNAAHRGLARPTDVLSFPIDGAGPLPAEAPPATRELGDVVICPAHTTDLREAIVHGMLHLLGMDHEVDDGEMLALQHSLLQRVRR